MISQFQRKYTELYIFIFINLLIPLFASHLIKLTGTSQIFALTVISAILCGNIFRIVKGTQYKRLYVLVIILNLLATFFTANFAFATSFLHWPLTISTYYDLILGNDHNTGHGWTESIILP